METSWCVFYGSFTEYNRTSLSQTRIFRITAYLEVKIWSLLKHETMTTGNKIMWKRGEIAPKEQFLLFSTIFSAYLYFQESNYIFIYEMWLFELFVSLKSAYLICRDTKYFRESLWLQDNESRLYFTYLLTLSTNLPTYTYQKTDLPTYLPAYLLTLLPTQPPTYLYTLNHQVCSFTSLLKVWNKDSDFIVLSINKQNKKSFKKSQFQNEEKA